MAVRSRGFRSKTRRKLRKSPRERGNPPVTHSLRTYGEGARVAIVINPAIHKGMPHPRFQGLTGLVTDRRGNSYLVRVRVGGKYKTIIARPEHLRLIPLAPHEIAQ